MSEKQFEIKVDDVDSSIINITRDGEDFAWFLSDIVTDKQVEKVVDLLNELHEENEQLKKENQRVYGIIEDGGVLLTRKQLLDVIGEDKFDMFFREQETSNKLQEIKADAKTALLIIKAMQPLPFTISISEAKSLIRLSENVGELLDTEGDWFMELNIKIDNNPLIKFKKKDWDNFVELISFEVWKALIKRRWDRWVRNDWLQVPY